VLRYRAACDIDYAEGFVRSMYDVLITVGLITSVKEVIFHRRLSVGLFVSRITPTILNRFSQFTGKGHGKPLDFVRNPDHFTLVRLGLRLGKVGALPPTWKRVLPGSIATSAA